MSGPLVLWEAVTVDYPGDEFRVCVAWSLEDAVAEVKRTYGPPYVVEWGEMYTTPFGTFIDGKFEHVQHYSVAHTKTVEFTPLELPPLPEATA